jgi:hypothetical protein
MAPVRPTQENSSSSAPPSDAYERFESLARRLVQVPKKEIDKEAEEYKADRKKNGRRKGK